MVKDTILYDRLNVEPTATDKELKKSYHKLSMKWHPDKNNSDEAKEKFQDISESYSILSDKEKRNIYDQVGISMLKNGGEMPMDPSEIFKNFMGGMGGMGGFPFGNSNFGGFSFGGPEGFSHSPFGSNSYNNRSNNSDYEDCILDVDVTLEQLYNHETISVEFNQKSYCKNCNGYGTANSKPSQCGSCNGTGRRTITRQMGNMVQQIVRSCNECNGSGENVSPSNKCKACDGSKFKIKKKTVDLTLNNNISSKKNIVIKSKGHVYRDNKSDLIINLNELGHDVFTKDGNDLHMKLNIKLYQVLFGFNKSIKHLDGRKLFINISKFNFNYFDDNLIYIVKNEGMNSNGNLIIHFSIDKLNTSKLQENEKIILKKILVKCNLDEFKKEVALLKEKETLVKTKVERYNPNSHYKKKSSPEREDNPAECIQQ